MYSFYLQQPQLIWSTNICVLIPTAVRIFNATETAIVAAIAHGQIDLLDTIIGTNVQGFVRLTNFHYLDRLIGCYFKDVKKFWIWFTIPIELYDFIDSTQIGSHVKHRVFLIQKIYFYPDTKKNQVEKR